MSSDVHWQIVRFLTSVEVEPLFWPKAFWRSVFHISWIELRNELPLAILQTSLIDIKRFTLELTCQIFNTCTHRQKKKQMNSTELPTIFELLAIIIFVGKKHVEFPDHICYITVRTLEPWALDICLYIFLVTTECGLVLLTRVFNVFTLIYWMAALRMGIIAGHSLFTR